jgi:hypothetical protein
MEALLIFSQFSEKVPENSLKCLQLQPLRRLLDGICSYKRTVWGSF